MATVTTFLSRQVEKNFLNGQAVYSENTLDFSAINASSADVVQALKIPAGALVEAVWCYIGTAEGGTMTFDIGDADDPNGYDDAVDGNATAGTMTRSLEATDALGVGKYYSSADTIDITLDNDADAMIITIVARYTVLESL
ncbi:hypothetical protein KAR91_64550 [Candidatus Pacearchaeota archaeon]|nr:hypothetical protein [Candidatus Pacearchaeota archaeon]